MCKSELIQYNKKRIYRIPQRYKYLRKYLGADEPLRKTLLGLLTFLEDHNINETEDDVLFFVSTRRASKEVRKNQTVSGTANRHLNMLCALRLIDKMHQGEKEEDADGKEVIVWDGYDWSKRFWKKYDNKGRTLREIGTYRMWKFDDEHLDYCEQAAKELAEHGITAGNISFNKLAAAVGLRNLAEYLYPLNSFGSADRKKYEYDLLMQVMDELIETQGYTTREQVTERLLDQIHVRGEQKLFDAAEAQNLHDEKIQKKRVNEIQKVFKLFRSSIAEKYSYKRPTQEEADRFGLENNQYIYSYKRQ